MEPQVLEQVDRQRIVELARDLADIVSITGDEKSVADYLGSEFEKLGMQVEYQEGEEVRPNVIGTLKGTGGGATLMFCAHMDHFDNPQEMLYRCGGGDSKSRGSTQRRPHHIRRRR